VWPKPKAAAPEPGAQTLPAQLVGAASRVQPERGEVVAPDLRGRLKAEGEVSRRERFPAA